MSLTLINNTDQTTYHSKQIPELSFVAVGIEGTATVEVGILAGNMKIPLQTFTASGVVYPDIRLYKPKVYAEVKSIGASSFVSVEA